MVMAGRSVPMGRDLLVVVVNVPAQVAALSSAPTGRLVVGASLCGAICELIVKIGQ